MTFNQFYTKLTQHDWFYAFSDDNSVYRRGNANESELQTIANAHDFCMFMYLHFIDVRDGGINNKEVVQLTIKELHTQWLGEDTSTIEVGSEVTYSGVPMFVGSTFTVTNINGDKATISIPFTQGSRTGNSYTTNQTYTVPVADLELV